MRLLKKLPELLEKSKREYEEMSAGAFTPWEVCPGEGEDKNWLARGDNLAFIKYLTDTAGLKGLFQTIYIDPPFNTEHDSFKYNDKFSRSTWLTFMKNRLEVALLTFSALTL